jgi:hypothetical protein
MGPDASSDTLAGCTPREAYEAKGWPLGGDPSVPGGKG